MCDVCFSLFTAYSSHGSKLSIAEVRKKRNMLFEQEKARQAAHVSRIEKIMVQHIGAPENCTLAMNKNLSTPYNCAMREYITQQKSTICAEAISQSVNFEDISQTLKSTCRRNLNFMLDMV